MLDMMIPRTFDFELRFQKRTCASKTSFPSPILWFSYRFTKLQFALTISIYLQMSIITSAPLYSKTHTQKIMLKGGLCYFLLTQNFTSLNILNILGNVSVIVWECHSQMLQVFLSIILQNFRLHILVKLNNETYWLLILLVFSELTSSRCSCDVPNGIWIF